MAMSVAVGQGLDGPGNAPYPARLTLLSSFELMVSAKVVKLPHSVERVLAFLGVHQDATSRTLLAASLWPDVTERRANADLRSALWRLRRIAGVIHEENRRLSLNPELAVDVTDMSTLSRSLMTGAEAGDLRRVPDLIRAETILPAWDEEWLVAERERYRMARLRALELAAEAMLEHGHLGRALDAVLASISTEPYRETAHRLAIRIHIAEGNHGEAIRAYEAYRNTVHEELGIGPSPLMEELVARLRPAPAAAKIAVPHR